MRSAFHPAVLLVLLWLLFVGLIGFSASQLPDTVATHFGASGAADGWMSRTSAVLFMLTFGFTTPLFIIAAFWIIIPRVPIPVINLPNKDYWLAPERRQATFSYLRRHSLWLACLIVSLMIGLYYAILMANAQPEPFLSTSWVGVMAGGFLALTVVWAVMMIQHFRGS